MPGEKSTAMEEVTADLAAASEALQEGPPADSAATQDRGNHHSGRRNHASFGLVDEATPKPQNGLMRKWSSRFALRRVDSLEIEASRVKGMESAHASYGNRKLPLALTLTLAYQTIGVVYGDLGTSPLYVFAAIFRDGPPSNDQVLGALSLIIYTFTLLPLIKYVFIVLRANDNGNGGTFALYSLICRHAKISVSQNQVPEDQEVSSYKLQLPSNTFKRSARLKEALQKSKTLRTVLLSIAVLGTCMVIGDGVLTPSISVLSAIQGIKTPAPKVSQHVVVAITCVILVSLFSVQRFGPDNVGYMFSPVVIVWFLSIGLIGVYNIIKHDPTVFKAFNPYYIFRYFKNGKRTAWVSLGGTVLCITGTEAMFADLGHFSVRAIQIAFTVLVYPCLLCAYIGQASYLMKYPENVNDTFFKSIPSQIYWPMFVVATGAAIIASQAMISATFAIVYQAMALGCFPRVKIVHTSQKYPGQIYIPEMNWLLMTLCVLIAAGFGNTSQIGNAYGVAVNADMLITTNLLTLVIIMIWQKPLWLALTFWGCLSSVELLYFSSVLFKIPQGGWVPLVFVIVFSIIMFTWHYGRVKKYEYEVQHKVSMDWVLGLGSSLGMARVPGIGLVYTELAQGVPTIFAHLISNLPAMHSVLAFVCIKYLPVPNVPDDERFLIRRLGPKKFRMYRCAVRFGYKDLTDNNEEFESLLMSNLANFLKIELGHFDPTPEEPLEEENGEKECTQVEIEEGNGIIPMNLVDSAKRLVRRSYSQNSLDGINNLQITQSIDADVTVDEELTVLDTAKQAGIVYLLGHTDIKASKTSTWVKKFVIDQVFHALKRNCRSSTVYLNIPHERLLQVGMIHNI